jgi:hypothetical protein
MRRLLAPALACLALTVSGMAVTAGPAHAEGEPVISEIDLATPGHAKGTVTTSAPYAAVVLRDYYSAIDVGQPVVLATQSGSAAFDLEAWGFQGGLVVSARACATAELSSCGTPVLTTDMFAPLDVQPEVTWPNDTTIGTGQGYSITVSDTGGGQLFATWSRDFDQTRTAVAHTGTTSLPLSNDGEGQVHVLRCNIDVPDACRDTGVARSLAVNREIYANASLPQVVNDTPISPAVGTKLQLNVYVNELSPVTLDWHLTRVSDGTAVDGFGGQVTGLGSDVASAHLLDLTGLGNGLYKLVGTVSKDTADFGTVTGTLPGTLDFRVDNTAPVIGPVTKSASTVYPFQDGYQDTVTISVPRTSYADVALLTIVRDSTGETIRTLSPYCPSCGKNFTFIWNARMYPATGVPAGTYSLTVSITDKASNRGEVSAGKVTVIRKKTEAHTYRKVVTAAGSKIDQRVGRCSTLRKPSLRGWAGSLGYYTNTKCRRTFDNSLVLTVHAVRAPQGAVKYGALRMWSYGGAAKAAPRSLAYFEILNRDDEWNEASTRMSPTLSSHGGAERVGAHFVSDDRYLFWRAYTAEGAKYDIKNFSVRLRYFTLVPE